MQHAQASSTATVKGICSYQVSASGSVNLYCVLCQDEPGQAGGSYLAGMAAVAEQSKLRVSGLYNSSVS